MKKILFALTSHDRKGNTELKTGFYLPEAAHPWAILCGAGFEIDFVSPRGGRPPMDGAENPDPVSRAFLAAPEVARKLAVTPRPAAVDAADYAAIRFFMWAATARCGTSHPTRRWRSWRRASTKPAAWSPRSAMGRRGW